MMKTKATSVFYKNIYFIVIIAISIAFLPQFAFGQTANHTVTVIVNPVTVINISVGTINLDIPSGATAVVVAGQDQMTVTDQTSTLLWGTNSSLQKITINTSLAVQKFTVQAIALSPTVGTAAPAVTLSTTALDFITNIGRSSGSASVQYTGIALASQGIGLDSHVITFTITVQ